MNTSPTYSESIAQFVAGLSIDHVPQTVLERAKLHALDALGIALASTRNDYGEAVHAAVRTLGHGEESSAIGYGTRLPAVSAALVNGTLIHGLDFDDTHIEAIHHATAPALAAALAVGERSSATGHQTLLGYVVGLEIGCRLAGAVPGELHDRGFHPTGVFGTFGAVGAAGRIMDLDAGTITRALGLAGSQAAGVLEIKESWLKRLHPGWAAHSAIAAVALSAAGFIGPRTIFEGAHGVYQAHVSRVPSPDEMSLHDLGSRWSTTEIALKPYPCCHFTHAFVDASLTLREQLLDKGVPLTRIDRIEAPTSERLLKTVAEPQEVKIAPRTTYDALFSIQYAVGLALASGRVDLASFYDDRYDDPEVLRIAAKVTCPIDSQSDYPRHFPGEVRLHLDDGTVLSERVPSSKGTRENPLSEDEVVAKFMETSGRAITARRSQEIAQHILTWEKQPDVAELMRLLDAGDRSSARPIALESSA